MSVISSLGLKNIGVMGGMFDPVHKGHLNVASSALQEFDFDEIRLIPCGSPVHRQAANGSDQDRITMLKLAVEDETKLVVDDRECRASGPSYTFNTLTSIKSENPKANLFLILGVDAFNLLASWHQWQKLFDLTHFIVITRPGWELQMGSELKDFTKNHYVSSFKEMCEFASGKILAFKFTPMDIGSTQVRELIKQQQSTQHLLPQAVLAYIKNKNLYT